MEWQPIETAPRDVDVIVWQAKREHIDIAMLCDNDRWVNWYGHKCLSVTHWMPLPAPPAARQPGEGESRG